VEKETDLIASPVINCLMDHRSIRRFRPEPVDPAALDAILRAGVRAATAGCLQQYSLVVVDDPAVKERLAGEPDPQSCVAEAPVVIVALVDVYRMKRWLALNDAPFYNDHVVSLLIGFWDAVIALHNIVVAAESLGLGTVYIGTVLSMDVSDILKTPEHVVPAGMVCIGIPDETPPLRSRLPLEAVVHHNGYQVPTDDEVRAYYDERDQDWFQHSEDWRQEWEAKGIHNTAQRVTVGHYTEAFLTGESRGILDNLRRACFRLSEG
jgi:nitroreductase